MFTDNQVEEWLQLRSALIASASKLTDLLAKDGVAIRDTPQGTYWTRQPKIMEA